MLSAGSSGYCGTGRMQCMDLCDSAVLCFFASLYFACNRNVAVVRSGFFRASPTMDDGQRWLHFCFWFGPRRFVECLRITCFKYDTVVSPTVSMSFQFCVSGSQNDLAQYYELHTQLKEEGQPKAIMLVGNKKDLVVRFRDCYYWMFIQ